MVFTDPPYNVKVASIQGRGKTKHREFAEASGELSSAEFTRFLVEALSTIERVSRPGALHYICMDWRHMEEMTAAGRQVYGALKNLVVWAKTNPGQGSFYRSAHELVFVYRVGEEASVNNVQLGRFGRNRSNVWTYAGVNTFRTDRMEELNLHPTVKPVALVADAMRDCTHRGDIVLDPFLGSGTTAIAAEKVGRIARGMEIDPLYVDTAIRRWQKFTGMDAVLDGDGATFGEVAARRAQRVRVRVAT